MGARRIFEGAWYLGLSTCVSNLRRRYHVCLFVCLVTQTKHNKTLTQNTNTAKGHGIIHTNTHRAWYHNHIQHATELNGKCKVHTQTQTHKGGVAQTWSFLCVYLHTVSNTLGRGTSHKSHLETQGQSTHTQHTLTLCKHTNTTQTQHTNTYSRRQAHRITCDKHTHTHTTHTHKHNTQT